MSRRREQPCPVTTRAIQRVFDGESREPALLEHIERCDRCAARLADLRASRDALVVLSGHDTGAGRLVRSARRAGLVAFVDGLADLIDALGELARSTTPPRGRKAPAVRERARVALASVRALAARLADEDPALASAIAAALPARLPAAPRAAGAVPALLGLLARIEGDSERVVRLRSRSGPTGA